MLPNILHTTTSLCCLTFCTPLRPYVGSHFAHLYVLMLSDILHTTTSLCWLTFCTPLKTKTRTEKYMTSCSRSSEQEACQIIAWELVRVWACVWARVKTRTAHISFGHVKYDSTHCTLQNENKIPTLSRSVQADIHICDKNISTEILP